MKPNDFSCCAGWDFVGPGTCNVARLNGNEGMEMYLATLYFFLVGPSASPFLSCFCFSLLTFLSYFIFLLKVQSTRAIAVKCDGSMYHVHVVRVFFDALVAFLYFDNCR